jgi:Tol biopolymer transport system component
MPKTYKVIINKIEKEEVQKKLAMALAKLTKKPPKMMYALVKRAPVVLFKSISDKKADFLRKKFGNTLKIVENQPEGTDTLDIGMEEEEPEMEVEEEPAAPEPEIPEPPAMEVSEVEEEEEESELPGLEIGGEEEEDSEDDDLPGLDIGGLEGVESVPEEIEEPEVEELGIGGIGIEPLPDSEEEEEGETLSLGGLGLETEEEEGVVGGIEMEEEEEDEEVMGVESMPDTESDEEPPPVPTFEPMEPEEEPQAEDEEPEEDQPMVICPNCDTPNVQGTRFCELCGFDLSKLPAKKETEEVTPEMMEEEEERPEPEKKKNPILVFLQIVLILALLGAAGYFGYFYGYKDFYLMRGITYVTEDRPLLRARHPKLSPNGDKVAFIGIEGGIYYAYLYDLTQEAPFLEFYTVENGKIEEILWSPIGDKLLISSTEKTQAKDGDFYDISILSIFDINQKKLEKVAYYTCVPAWRPGGEWISYVNQNTKKLVLHNIDTEEQETLKSDGDCAWIEWITTNQFVLKQKGELVLMDIEDPENPTSEVIDDDVQKSMWTTTPAPIVSPDKEKILYTKNEKLLAYNLANATKKEVARGLTEVGKIKEDLIEPGTGADWLADSKRIIYTDCLTERGIEPGKLKISSIQGGDYPFNLKFSLDMMGEPDVVGNKLAFVGKREVPGIPQKGLDLENVFVVDLVEVGILQP